MDLDGLTQSMIPDFALSLSADGIALLFRAADGWRSVAETPFDAEDLTPALAAMREDALRLAPDGIHCKLILPNDQIRYLTVETGDLPAEERLAAARQALQGATPYAVDELAFDISAEGGSTHIAAVALETLDEAESFAVEHGFAPVGFVAVPGDSGFQGEPFFGTTRAFRGTGMAAGSAPVTVIGPVEFPEPTAEVPAALDAAEALPVEPEAAAELPPEFVAGELTGELTEAEALDEPQESAPDTDAPVKIPPAPPAAAAETETGQPATLGRAGGRINPDRRRIQIAGETRGGQGIHHRPHLFY